MVQVKSASGKRSRRKRCLNDGTLFLPATNRPRETCKFCSEACRKEFHRYGGINFYKQRAWIQEEVKKAVKATFTALDPILAKLDDRLSDLEQLEIDELEPGEEEDDL